MPERDWEQAARDRRGVVAAAAVAAVAAVALGWLAGPGLTGGGEADPLAGRSPQPGDDDAGEPVAGEGTLEIRTEDAEGAEPLAYHRGWLVLPHAPLVRRHGHSTVWTGSHLVVWGGVRSDERHHGTGLTYLRSGASYDPVSRRWRRLPPSPLEGRLGQVAVAADGEMVVWGGRIGDTGPAGAAYDPNALRWRSLPPGPVDAARPRGAAWTGRFVLVWGEDGGRLVAAAYEPATGTWHAVPDPPVVVAGPGSDAAWADDRLVVWTPPETGDRALLASWQPQEHRWRLLRPVAPAAGPARLLAAGEHLLAWGGEQGREWAFSYHLPTRVREPLDPLPLAVTDELVAGYDGESVMVWSARDNRTLRVDPATGDVEDLAASPLAPRWGTDGDVWPGGLVVWGGASAERHYSDGAVFDLAAGTAPDPDR